MDVWLIWLILALALGVAELFTLTAALGILGGAALVTVGFAAVGLPPVVQLAVFAVASTAGILLVRPVARRHMLQPRIERFGVDALVGRTARVIAEVSGQDGRVLIGGEEWTAHALDETTVIPTGTVVDVMQINGTTAIVYPRDPKE
ncbi:NfeD family protein [Qaidamihabitans albus]|uniref:NfeD family protein n=1 Tax=Qaidamihabitans albus TaxID=2795733 RepID=UPI0018F2037B|nr:NfeD family protein [Qaidamihabitans albus]